MDYPIFSLLCTLLSGSGLFCINFFYPKMGDQKRMIYSLISCQDLFFLSKLFSFLGDKFYNLRLSCKNLASQMSLPYKQWYTIAEIFGTHVESWTSPLFYTRFYTLCTFMDHGQWSTIVHKHFFLNFEKSHVESWTHKDKKIMSYRT